MIFRLAATAFLSVIISRVQSGHQKTFLPISRIISGLTSGSMVRVLPRFSFILRCLFFARKGVKNCKVRGLN